MIDLPLQSASQDIWAKKYQLKTHSGELIDETVDDTYKRVAKALSEVEPKDQEEWYGKFLWALRNGAVGAGRIMSNVGAQAQKSSTSTINCTVSNTVGDSIEGILQSVKEAGITLSAGCGIGYDFTTLRPKGAYIGGVGATTGGTLSFMDVFDAMCFTISSAGGRRGAQMGVLEICHPDIEEFIKAKREDGRLRQFNLSILITDAFMKCLKEDGDWDLYFPLNKKEKGAGYVFRKWPSIEDYMTVTEDGLVRCKVYKTVKARELWAKIMKSTYDFAEPGFIMIDEANRMNNNYFCEQIRATNPCVTGDTWVHTNNGPRKAESLVGEPFCALVNGTEYLSEGFFSSGVKPVYTLMTKEGYSLRLTEDHQLLTEKFGWLAAKDCIPGTKLVLNDHRSKPEWRGKGTNSEGYLLGFLVGDGTLLADKAILGVWGDSPGVKGRMSAVLAAVSTMKQRSDFKGWRHVKDDHYRLTLRAVRELATSVGMTSKEITEKVEGASSSFCSGFLRGFFDTDGSVQGTQAKGVSVRLSQSNLPRLEAVQRMLLRLGIGSKIFKNRRTEGFRSLPDGKGGYKDYPIMPQHELVISGINLELYRDRVGFSDTDKFNKLDKAIQSYVRKMNKEKFLATVESFTLCGEEEVYDVQIPVVNCYDANGVMSHNCGEQFLPPYGSCLLGSINLTKFIRNPFSDQAEFDWEKYRKVVDLFTRMLDNVVEINGLPLPEQRREIEYKRRHGMGYFGLGSAMTMLCMKYGSKESVDFTSEVTRQLAYESWYISQRLAVEKGCAPIFNSEENRKLFMEGPYMQRMAKENSLLADSVAQFGARFTHATSIAPTGTIALSFGNNCSNGIEPSFEHEYQRNVIREGKKTKEMVTVYSYEALLFHELFPGQELPSYFSKASTITPKEHVDIQAAAQYWVDASISKTINVPTDIPFEEFEGIYMYAYEKGLKGCTTFRFNPAAFQGVLVTNEDLESTTYTFTLENGEKVELKGNEEIEYDGETHTAANLYDALKEGYYGKF